MLFLSSALWTALLAAAAFTSCAALGSTLWRPAGRTCDVLLPWSSLRLAATARRFHAGLRLRRSTLRARRFGSTGLRLRSSTLGARRFEGTGLGLRSSTLCARRFEGAGLGLRSRTLGSECFRTPLLRCNAFGTGRLGAAFLWSRTLRAERFGAPLLGGDAFAP